MKFRLNQEKLRSLCALRGWRFPYTDLAKAASHSRSYVRRIVLGEEKLTEGFMLKYINIAGADPNSPKEWGSLFELDLSNDVDISNRKWNFPKLSGQVPYVALSSSFEHQRREQPDLEQEPFEDGLKRRFEKTELVK